MAPALGHSDAGLIPFEGTLRAANPSRHFHTKKASLAYACMQIQRPSAVLAGSYDHYPF